MDPRDRKEVRALFDSLISGKSSEGTIEYLTERKDGEMRLFRATASPLLDNPAISRALSPPPATSPRRNAWSSNLSRPNAWRPWVR